MQTLNTDSGIWQTIVTTAVTAIGSVFSAQKLIKIWKGSSVEIGLIEAVHKELDRLSVHNKTLSDELASVQKDFLKLNRDIRELSDENQALHYEVNHLTLEVKRLNELLVN